VTESYVVTISHLVGAGGAHIGMGLSQRLNMPFVDRDVLKFVAQQLQVPEEEVEHNDERVAGFWRSFLRMQGTSADPVMGLGVAYTPSGRDLFKAERTYIKQIAEHGPAIFLGRGARYILRANPRHFSVFIYANLEDRVARVAELSGTSSEDARAAVEEDDRERGRYMSVFTRMNWLDPRTYDLCLNTSSVGLDGAATLVGDCIEQLWRGRPGSPGPGGGQGTGGGTDGQTSSGSAGGQDSEGKEREQA
jgi:cytidylate kinase